MKVLSIVPDRNQTECRPSVSTRRSAPNPVPTAPTAALWQVSGNGQYGPMRLNCSSTLSQEALGRLQHPATGNAAMGVGGTSASGELIFNIFPALGPFERRLIQERTKAGMTAARARSR